MAVKHHRPDLLSKAKGAIHKGIEIAGVVKGAWDLGKLVYSGIRTIAPIAARLAPLALGAL